MEIIFDQVSFSYGEGTPFEKKVLNRISFQIPSGQFVALMGETGSGKTTLAQMINGLLRPSEGEVRVGSYRLGKKKQNLRGLREKIGYAFQYPEHQLFEETVWKDIRFTLEQYDYPEELIHSRVKRAMERVGLSYEEFKDRSPFQLSGGQMRRVALAGILVHNPRILILDEPTAGLDPQSRLQLLNLFKQLQTDEGTTVIYITHHLEEALEFADRIIVLKEGEIALDLLPKEVPAQLSRLAEAGILDTPLLRFIEIYNRGSARKIPNDCITEKALVSSLIEGLKGGG